MKKVFKVAAASIVFLIILVITIPFFVDLNDYKPQISDAVYQATGRDLEIEGDINLSLFPWIGAELGAVRLGNAAGFSDVPFAQMKRMDIKLKVLPLLKKSIEMKAVVLHDLGLNLEVNKQGVSNWDDLSKSSEEQPKEPETKSGSDSGALPLESLSVDGIEIIGARIVYSDHQAGTKYVLDNLTLETGEVTLNEPLDLTFNTDFTSSQPKVSGNLSLKSHIVYDLDGQQFNLEDTIVRLVFDSSEFASKGEIDLDFDAALDLAAERYELNDIKLQLEVANPDMPGGKAVAALSLAIAADLKSQIATVDNLKLNSYGLNLDGSIKAQKILDAPSYSADFKLASFSPRELMQRLAIEIPEMADTTVLSTADLQLSIKGATDFIEITRLDINFDDTSIIGKAAVHDFEKPAISYDLRVSEIDIDRYLPPSKESAKEVAAAKETSEPELPLETLRNLNVDGRFSLESIKVANLQARDIRADLVAKNGVIRINPLGMTLYDGKYSGDISFDVTNDTPLISLNEKISGVQAGLLLKDLMGDDLISGTANLQARVTAQGLTPEKVTETLNGTANFMFSDGAVKGFNIAHMMRKAKAKLKGKTLPDNDIKKTDFAKLSGSFSIENGVVSNNDLEAALPFARVTGKGVVDLPKEALDYLVMAKVVNTSKGQGGAELSELRGITVPVRIEGSFSEPSVKLDMDKLMSDKAKAKLKEKKAELKSKADEAKKKLESEADAKKEELKARADAKKAEAEQRLKEKQEALEEKAKEKLKSFFE